MRWLRLRDFTAGRSVRYFCRNSGVIRGRIDFLPMHYCCLPRFTSPVKSHPCNVAPALEEFGGYAGVAVFAAVVVSCDVALIAVHVLEQDQDGVGCAECAFSYIREAWGSSAKSAWPPGDRESGTDWKGCSTGMLGPKAGKNFRTHSLSAVDNPPGGFSPAWKRAGSSISPAGNQYSITESGPQEDPSTSLASIGTVLGGRGCPQRRSRPDC